MAWHGVHACVQARVLASACLQVHDVHACTCIQTASMGRAAGGSLAGEDEDLVSTGWRDSSYANLVGVDCHHLVCRSYLAEP